MPVPSARPLSRRLGAFALTTAIGALFPWAAVAQTTTQVRLPKEADIRGIRTDGFDPQVTERGDTLRVDVRARNTVIDWNGFNIPENGTVDFTNGRLLGGSAAVLNRDVSANPSQLLGKLTSDSNVAVWVHNANGILVGSKASFNTGSLVLTTLDISPADFVRAGDSYRLKATATGEQSAITVQDGAKLFVKGETRGLVMIAPKIDAQGSFVAEGQDVAFVTAADVTLDYRNGSPLSVTLNRGTAVAGTSQYVRGTVAGNNALFALASQGTLTDSLLRVSAEVTTASAGSRGIVLSAGRPANAVAGVEVDGDADATGGIAGLLVEGPLRTQNNNADVIARATGAIDFAGSIDSRDDLLIEAGGALAMRSDLTAGGDLRLTGRGVTLGGTDSATQRAGGQLRVTSIDGDIVGSGALTLRSGATTDDGLLLETTGVARGDIALGDASRLIGGNDRSGGVTLRRRDGTNGIAIGAVVARTLRGAVGTGGASDGLRATAAIRTGDIDVRNRLTLEGAGVTTGTLRSDGAVDVRSAGAATTGGIFSGDMITVVAGGALTVGGDVVGGDDVALGGTSVTLDGGAIRSPGAIDIAASTGGITGSRALAIASTGTSRSDTIRLRAAGSEGIALVDGSAITGGTDRALDVRIFTAADAPLALGDVTARSLGTMATFNGDPTAAGGAFWSSGSLAFGRLNLVQGFIAESTGGNLTIGRIAVTGDRQGIDLRAAGTLSVQSDLETSGAIKLSSGTDLTLGTIRSRDNAITITSGGVLRVGALTSATGVAATGTVVTSGDVRGGSGAATITATTGDLVMGSGFGRSVRLRADGGAVRVNGTLVADVGAVDVAAGGALTVTGALSAANGVSATGTAVTLGEVRGGSGAATIIATAGDLTMGGASGTGVRVQARGGAAQVNGGLVANTGGVEVTAARALSVTGAVRSTGGGVRLASTGGAVSATGGVASDGAATLSGTAITLGGAQTARGAYTATASAGGITRSGGGVSIASDSDNVGGEGVTLAATGGAIDLADTGVTGGGVVRLTTDGGGITVGDVVAAGLVATGATTQDAAIRTGDLTVGGPVSLAAAGDVTTGAITTDGAVALTGGAIRFGTVRGGSLSATARTGALTGGDVTTRGGIAVQATGGAVTLGRLASAQGDVAVTAGGPLFANGVTAGGTATVIGTATDGDVVVAEGIGSQGAVTVRSGRDIRTPFIRSANGALTVAAPNGRLSGFVAGTGTSLSAGAAQPFSLTIGTDALLGDVVGGNIAITATSITANRIDGGALPVALRATVGDLRVAGPVTGSDVSLTAAGQTLLGSVVASGAVTLGGAGGLSFDTVSGASITATGGAITGRGLRAGGAIDLRGAAVTLDSVEAASLAADATGAVRLAGPVTIGGGYRVTAGSIALGGAAQRAAGPVRLTATGGAITGAGGLTLTGDTLMILDATGGIDLSAGSLRTGGALSLRAGNGQAIRLGTVQAGALGGYDGTTTLDRLTHDGTFATGDLTVGRMAVTLTTGDLSTGRLAATGPVSLLATTGAIRTADLTASTLDARAGSNLTLGTTTVTGSATLEANAIDVPSITAGDLSVNGGTVRLGTVSSTGAVALRGGSIEVREKLAAARALLAEARSALTLQDVSAGGDIALTAGGAVTARDVSGTGAIGIDGAGVTLGAIRAGGALRVTSGNALSLISATGNGITLDAGGLVRAGALDGGPLVSIRAADAELSGAIVGSAVRFATRDPATTALRVGDGTATTGFRLSAAEVGLIGADTLTFDAASGALEIGTMSLAPAAGRAVDLLSTGNVSVTGQFRTTGTGRTVRIGGDGASGNAATIHVVATSDAGGRLLLDGADLELRGNRIAAGLAPGFLDTLQPGDAGREQAQVLVGNPNSSLYNPQLGGGFFAPDATTMIAARSLTVRFGDYALFQNTAVPGRSSGVVVGGTVAAPVTPALRISSFGSPGAASFAFFGDINGITGAGAALLGNPVIDIEPALLPNSRINGCLAGSGAGCLTTIVIQPTLQVFDWDSQEVFGILQDVSLPFTPIIGGNNEELLSGLPALAPEVPETATQPQEPPR